MWTLFRRPTHNPDASDESLLGALARGDEAAFLIVYRRRQGGIYRYALQMTGSAESAAEATQETFLELLRGAGRLDAERGSVSSWLYAVVRKKVLQQLTRERRYQPLAEDEDEPAGAADIHQEIEEAQRAERMRELVAGLPAAHREVLVLCVLEGMGYAEAARVIGVPEGTVRSRLHRAKVMLAERLRAGAAAERRGR